MPGVDRCAAGRAEPPLPGCHLSAIHRRWQSFCVWREGQPGTSLEPGQVAPPTGWARPHPHRHHLYLSRCLSCVSYSVVQLDLGHAPEPRHILSRHTLPVTDLHCGLMGAQARVATSSLDQTVKVTVCNTASCLCPFYCPSFRVSSSLPPVFPPSPGVKYALAPPPLPNQWDT